MDTLAKLRRSSFTPTFGNSNQEPLIVVEESEQDEKEESDSKKSSPLYSLDVESPVNPYLLSPWRDPRETRKHSLPTPPCTSGITASQVRRLSERGNTEPTAVEQAFLATLTQGPAPQPGGRRHSVVTISKVPITLFGRNRRESIAAVPNFNRCNSSAGSRRESITGTGPPSTDVRGSVHNLQLDIMDDIVQARKARMKLWNTSNEKVCEVQLVDEAGLNTSSAAMQYTKRRYSDFVATILPPIHSLRRSSENPSMLSPNVSAAQSPSKKAGIICTNTDLISLLSSLASSASEINHCGDTTTSSSSTTIHPSITAQPQPPAKSNFLKPELRSSLKKSNRSNSFDVSILKGLNLTNDDFKNASTTTNTGPGWFAKRHQPVSKRTVTGTAKSTAHATVTFAKDTFEKLTDSNKASAATATASTSKNATKITKPRKLKSPLSRLKWDGRSAIVDARIIGSAIEGFLRRDSSPSSSKNSKEQKDASRIKKSNKSGWFSRTEDEDSSGDTCDSSSLCATLKDLFVK